MKYLLKVALAVLIVPVMLQSCNDKGFEGSTKFAVSTTTLKVGVKGGKQYLTISSPSTWTITSNDNWIDASPTGGSAGRANKVTLSISQNTDEEYRVGTLTVKASAESKPLTVTITQDGLNGGPTGEYHDVNQWILSTLSDEYLWNKSIPKNPDMTADYQTFLKRLVLSADGKDTDGTVDGGTYTYGNGTKERYVYSYVDGPEIKTRAAAVDDYNQPTYGFDYSPMWVGSGGNGKIACFVTWVRDGSPAAKKGLKRGDWIDKHDGATMASTTAYYAFEDAVLYDAYAGSTLTIGTRSGSTMTLTAEVMELSPLVIAPKVITVGTRKVGYLVYYDFEVGPKDGTSGRTQLYKFDNYLRAAFGTTFKDVDELVVDLRYNPGGYVSSCEIMCALISGADDSQVFAKLAYNDRDSEDKPSDDKCYIWDYAKESNALTGLSRVFVLATSASASASEMVINSLRGIKGDDFVIHIGETTEGKNVGMDLYEKRINGSDYEMWPITFKVHNSKGFADYANGFTPDTNNQITDYSDSWYMGDVTTYELGDVNEPLLKRALAIIQNKTTRAGHAYAPADRSKLVERRFKPRAGLRRLPATPAED